MVKCTYFLDVLSQWCFIADRALQKARFSHLGNLEVEYRFVPIASDGPLQVTHDEQLRVYRRSRMISGVTTRAWIEPSSQVRTWEANAATMAAAKLGGDIDVVRARVARAALVDGLPLGRPGQATAFVSGAFGIDEADLRRVMDSAELCEEIRQGERRFADLGLKVRPSFVLSNSIDDHIVLGGQYSFEVLSASIGSLVADEAAYAYFEEHGDPSHEAT
jgi:predicted DsbA family dithiol-disulfide isomerase